MEHKKKKVKNFIDIESPHRLKTYEERTGKVFNRKVNFRIVDLGNSYGIPEPLDKKYRKKLE